jgi:hypothetical protein
MLRVLSVSVFAVTLLMRSSFGQAPTPTPASGAQANGTANASGLGSIGPHYDVTQFGAAGTGFSTTGSINVGTDPNLLSVASNSGFAPGQKYNIPGAGEAGANLIITVTHVSGSSITFTPAASTTVNRVTIDDTAGIQAAFNACNSLGSGTQFPAHYGGVVEFPGIHRFIFSSTINAWDTCGMVGIEGNQGPSDLRWNGAAAPSVGTVVSFTSATTAYNRSSITILNAGGGNRKEWRYGHDQRNRSDVCDFWSHRESGQNRRERHGDSDSALEDAQRVFGQGISRRASHSPTRLLEWSTPGSNSKPAHYRDAFDKRFDPDNRWLSPIFSASNPAGSWEGPQPYEITVNASKHVLDQSMGDPAGLHYLCQELWSITPWARSARCPAIHLPSASPTAPAVLGTFTDSCTATSINVGIAFDGYARFEQLVKDILIANAHGITTAQQLGVSLFFGSRADTTTRLENAWIDGALYFDIDFAGRRDHRRVSREAGDRMGIQLLTCTGR